MAADPVRVLYANPARSLSLRPSVSAREIPGFGGNGELFQGFSQNGSGSNDAEATIGLNLVPGRMLYEGVRDQDEEAREPAAQRYAQGSPKMIARTQAFFARDERSDECALEDLGRTGQLGSIFHLRCEALAISNTPVQYTRNQAGPMVSCGNSWW
jgi:hypothetical protein